MNIRLAMGWGDLRKLVFFPQFCRQLEELLRTGIPLQEALALLSEDLAFRRFQKQIHQLHHDVVAGLPFCEALSQLLPDWIPFRFSGLESPPNLSLFLGQLDAYFSEKNKQIELIVAQLRYPLFLFFACITVVVLITQLVWPQYRAIQAQFSGAMPVETSMFSGFWWGCLAMSVLALIKYRLQISKQIGRFFFPFTAADFLWVMGMLMGCGYSLSESLSLVAKADYLKAKKIYQEVSVSGEFARVFAAAFELSGYHRHLLCHAQASSQSAEGFLEVARSLRNKESGRIFFWLKMVQPVMLVGISVLIMGCFYVLIMPMLSTLSQLPL